MGDREARAYQFGQDYQETVRLTDGRRVFLRPIVPDDRELLLRGFERLSPESRYRRFMTSKNRLTEAELRYFTEVDGVDHFAIIAGRRRPLLGEEGVGVGRFVRLSDRPEVAEPAITVADDYQGKGLGSTLLQRLCAAARERDVKWFRSEVLAENVAIKALFESMSEETTYEPGGAGVTVVSVRLPPSPPEAREDDTARQPLFKRTPLYRLLSSVAEQRISIEPRVTRPPPAPED